MTQSPNHADTSVASIPDKPASIGWRLSRLRAVLLAIALVVLGLVTVMGLRLARGDHQLGEVKLQPYAAPNFAVDLFDGGHFSLAQERDSAVVINFWASWCVPCQTEAPVLEGAFQRYQGQGVRFIGVDIKDTPDDARSFLRRHVSTYPNGFDAQKQIYIDYGVYGLPETFVVDRNGMVIHHVIGPVTEAQLDSWLRPLVAAAR
jgi:cytochrome c biogenesis protein CcmG/thiol:disulfide interchange protein DsbE